MTSPPVPSFTEINRKRLETATDARIAGYTAGPRWARITLDRATARLLDTRWPPGPARELFAAIGADMATLFVHSHTHGMCFVSSFEGEYVTVMTPRVCADTMTAALVLAELGDITLARKIAPLVAAAAAEVRAAPTRRERCRIAGPITDRLARDVRRVFDYRPDRDESRRVIRRESRPTPDPCTPEVTTDATP